MASRTNSQFDENRWIIQIRQTLEDELDDHIDIPVSIFSVPKSLMINDPDFYVPQQIALGPYHHCRAELLDMDRYKLAAAKVIQKQLHSRNFHDLVSQLSVFEARIRAVYHKYLDFSSETLMWIMSMDTSFLLEFLQIYATNDGKIIGRVSSQSSHNAILKDIIMLENQIPLFLLRKMLELQYTSLELADTKLLSMLLGFCKEISPFKIVEELLCNNKGEMMECAHLLDFLYNVIIPTKSDSPSPSSETAEIEDEHVEKEPHESRTSFGKSIHVKNLLDEIWKVLSKIKDGPVRLIKKILFSRPLKMLLKFPWAIISSIPVIRVIKEPIEYLLFSEHKQEEKPESKSQPNKPPLMEEISIPSVNELVKAGVKFFPANEGILSISFDTKTASFYLPPISLDVNSVVVLRNLVAYEACNASIILVFTRYTEMMNGIIDNEDDAKFLREKGIILNRLKSDSEVANLWNGMSRSVRLTKVPFLDKVIEDVNKYYNGKWKVKIGKFMRRYVFESWQFLTLIAAVILLLLMTLQAFCSVYSCTRIFHVKQGLY